MKFDLVPDENYDIFDADGNELTCGIQGCDANIEDWPAGATAEPAVVETDDA